MPVSRTRITISPRSSVARTVMRPPGGVYFAALVSRFETTWFRRIASPRTHSLSWDVNVKGMGPLVEQRRGNLDGFRHHFRNFDELVLEFDLSSCDPGDVEEVVHQARQVTDLALDDRALPLQSAATELHQLQGRQDRRQRIPQLVAQHGQELVFGPIGGFRLLPGELLAFAKLAVAGLETSCGERCPAPPLRRRRSRLLAFRIGEMVSEMSMRRAVLGHTHRLKVLDSFTANDSLEDLLLFIETLGRDQHGNRLPDRLMWRCIRTAAQPLCSTTE